VVARERLATVVLAALAGQAVAVVAAALRRRPTAATAVWAVLAALS
jgi:uncharacterized protein YoaH (UPF0181 family)